MSTAGSPPLNRVMEMLPGMGYALSERLGVSTKWSVFVPHGSDGGSDEYYFNGLTA